MRTIAEFVDAGINSKAELEDALRLAMQLEFATLPPYLCAEWSIDPSDDPDKVARTINAIAEQEMFHFALAGNILSAIGGTPHVDRADFVPSYPTHELPGGIVQALAVDLAPLSHDQLAVFVQIEKPEFTPLALALEALPPATIGDFYTRLAQALQTLRPSFDPAAKSVDLLEAKPVRSLDEALAAIALIKEEGEGTELSPDQATAGTTLAHYYAFKQLLEGHRLQKTGDEWHFDGPSITLPKVFGFAPAPAGSDASAAFNQAFTKLLKSLQNCWTTAGRLPDVGAMFAMQKAGIALVKSGIRPEFKWDDRG